jgi:hypothetical protein
MASLKLFRSDNIIEQDFPEILQHEQIILNTKHHPCLVDDLTIIGNFVVIMMYFKVQSYLAAAF